LDQILAMELGDLGIGVGFVVAELFLGLALFVAGGHEIIAVVDLVERTVGDSELILRNYEPEFCSGQLRISREKATLPRGSNGARNLAGKTERLRRLESHD
jgi:hypothetical protein